MQKAGGSNDMIALVWFVSRFFVTKAFGRASPPAFSFGFPCFHIHFKNKLNRNGLLVHCGILTSTVWYIFFFFFGSWNHIFVYVFYAGLGFVVAPFKSPWSAADGKSEWATLCEHPAAPAEGCGWTGGSCQCERVAGKQNEAELSFAGGLIVFLFGFCLHEARLKREVFFDGKIRSLSNPVSQSRVGGSLVVDKLTFLELHGKTLMWKHVICTLDGRSSSHPPQIWFNYSVSRYSGWAVRNYFRDVFNVWN